MSFLGDLRERISDFNLGERIPTGDRLYSLLAVVVIVAAIIGNILLVGLFIVPQWRAWNELASQLAAAEQQLVDAGTDQGKSTEQLQEELATAQAELDEAGSVFFSESEAADVLSSLYQYADDSGVRILDLQHQPGPEQEEKSIYDVNVFQLQAVGATLNLVNFVSRIEEAASRGFIIDNVNIVEGDVDHILTLDFMLYTSPYSSGIAVEPSPEVTPSATPENLTQLVKDLEATWASNDWEQAIIIIYQIAAIDPDYDDLEEKLYRAYVNYGYSLLEQGDTGGATTQFNLALGINPNGEEALAGLQQAAVTPTPTLTAEEQLAQRLDTAWAEENWEEVIGLIEQLQAINPDYDDLTEKLYAAYVNYGYALAAEGKLEEAKEAFSRALEIKPNGAEAIAGLQELAGEALPPTPIPEPQYTIHVVQRGENLFRIALRYGTTVEAIMAANGLTNYNIYVGQQLRIPLP